MAESLSNVFDNNLFRRYFSFERVNLNPEYHPRLTSCRQWKNVTALLIRRIIALRRLACGGSFARHCSSAILIKNTSRHYSFVRVRRSRNGKYWKIPKKNLTAPRMTHNILTGHGDVDVAVDFTNTHTFARVYNKELQWLLLS